jgi:hypothetical protein
MKKKYRFLAVPGLAITLAASGLSEAAVTIYTDRTLFELNTDGVGVDTYGDFTTDGELSLSLNPMNRTAGGFDYSASTSANVFYVIVNSNYTALSMDQESTMTFTFTDSITAAGGNIFMTDAAGDRIAGNMIVTFNFESGGNSVQTLTAPQADSFFGITSTERIVSMVVAPESSALGIFATMDNLTMAQAVPEPSLVLSSWLGACVFLLRRRK